MFIVEPTPQAVVTLESLSHYRTVPNRCPAFYGDLRWIKNHLHISTELFVCTLGTDAEWIIILPIEVKAASIAAVFHPLSLNFITTSGLKRLWMWRSDLQIKLIQI